MYSFPPLRPHPAAWGNPVTVVSMGMRVFATLGVQSNITTTYSVFHYMTAYHKHDFTSWAPLIIGV
ncbi:hypothetical protein PanWU01x14_004140 [Parasponia andersonii]|uniref:Uncharacterized protein n=1 Tax=Parasponia andersonii TaxID=3476 RepID=A0A2P5E341_PARAD|nr:hypothetical protein PanWU01x14_004140 [Parasponia andersonii]